MKIVKPVALAKARDVGMRFVVARYHVHAIGPRLQNGTDLFEPAREVDQIAGGEVVVGLRVHQLLKSRCVVMNVRKDQQPHDYLI